MKFFLRLLIPLLLTTTALSSAFAAKPAMVLLPIQGAGLSAQEKDVLRATLQEGLAGRYQVFSGAEVDKKLEKFTKITCDAKKCLQEVAIAFQGELVGRGIILPNKGDYILTIEIKNVFEDKVIESKTEVCDTCRFSHLIGLLKGMAQGRSSASTGVQFSNFRSSTSGPESSVVEQVKVDVSGDEEGDVALLIIESQPSGAVVYLGGRKAGITPYQNFDLTPGQRLSVTLKKTDYHDKQIEFTLRGGTNEIADVKLKPAFGHIEVKSKPSGAAVYMAGEKVGVTPYIDKRITSGSYLLTLKYPLYKTIANQDITINDGQWTREKYHLKANFGYLEVDGVPRGANIKITGKKGQEIATGTTSAQFKLEPGRYELSISEEGYEEKQYDLTIALNKTATINREQGTLRRLEGRVLVTSEPFERGAKIYVDGASQEAGQVPAKLTLSAGKHQIKIVGQKKQGEKSVWVKDRESQSLAVILKNRGGIVTGRTCAAKNRYKDNGDGTVTDIKNGLMWQRCSLGQSGPDCERGKAKKFNWNAAQKEAKALNKGGFFSEGKGFAGFYDWRVPTIDELKLLVEEGCSSPKINLVAFPNTRSSSYWSSSPNANYSSYAWVVIFGNGYSSSYVNRSDDRHVRLLRSGQ